MRLQLLLAAASAACLAACAAPAPAPTDSLTLVTTTPIVRDLVENLVMGVPGAKVVSLVPLGADPHEYAPTPGDARVLAGARAIVVVGARYEDEWLGRFLQNAGATRTIITAAEGIDLLPIASAGSGVLDRDPHIWLDPIRWQQATLNVAHGLAALEPALGPTVNANAAAYLARLGALDTETALTVATIPPAERVLVTTHDALGYYAARYGFSVAGVVLPGGGSEVAPSAQDLRQLVDAIRTRKPRAIFTEAGLDRRITETVARETGIAIIDSLYVDTLSPTSGPAPNLVDLIRHNTSTIVGALR